MTTRRSFLSSILAAAAAPAIVKAESLMPIWVPKNAGEILKVGVDSFHETLKAIEEFHSMRAAHFHDIERSVLYANTQGLQVGDMLRVRARGKYPEQLRVVTAIYSNSRMLTHLIK